MSFSLWSFRCSTITENRLPALGKSDAHPVDVMRRDGDADKVEIELGQETM